MYIFIIDALKYIISRVEVDIIKAYSSKKNNKGAVDTANNWSSGGRIKRVKLRFWSELKEAGIIKTVWFKGWSDPADTLLIFANMARRYMGMMSIRLQE